MTPPIFLYDDDAHVERLRRVEGPVQGARGLVGRQVASSEFFDAYLAHGTWTRLAAVVRNEPSRASLSARFRTHPAVRGTSRSLDIVPLGRFHERFFPTPPGRVLHVPQPVDVEYAWARHHARPHAYALSGVTHTICTRAVAERFCQLVTGPFEAYDTLFCISRASIAVIRAITDNYCAWLAERHGGEPRMRVRLEHVPLGVDTELHRPATAEERALVRRELGIPPEALVVLFLGRLNHFGKVHPFPMFAALWAAARAASADVRLILAGWAEDDRHIDYFRAGAVRFGGGVPTTVVDATRPSGDRGSGTRRTSSRRSRTTSRRRCPRPSSRRRAAACRWS